MTYEEFIDAVKSIIFPDREPSNLVAVHEKYILDGLIEVQKRIPQLRSWNFDSLTFGDTFYQCRATVITKPNGPVIRLYTYTQDDHCDRVYYQPVSREHMEALLQSCGVAGQPTGSLVGPPPRDYYEALGMPSGTSTAQVAAADEVEPTLSRIAINPASLIGGLSATGTVDVLEPAPVGGLLISLLSSNPLVVTIPTSVTIPAGAKSATFPVTTTETAATVQITISATLGSKLISTDLPVHDPNITTDKGWRASTGHYAVIGDLLYVWPHIESYEHTVIEWQGVKTSYNPNDLVTFERDVQSVVELYVQAQTALREDCDANRYNALQASWLNNMAELVWWYRKKYLLPEAAWRASGCDPCITTMAPTTAGGEPEPPGPGPEPTTWNIYLGNAGSEEPPPDTYTPDFIKALDNTFGSPSNRQILPGEYEISRPVSDLSEWRIVCIPLPMWPGTVHFTNSGFPYPMAEMTDRPVIDGLPYRVFRTTNVQIGTISKAQGNPLVISLI
jgi:hypothetical protein